MKKSWKRYFAGLLVVALLLVQIPVQASARGMEAAQELYRLGLFKGTGTHPDGSPNFELERAATRGEGIAMLVRLLGGEQEARNSRYSHPFADAGWAEVYVGYAYEHQISKGVSAVSFGTGERMDRNQFLTLVLRALGRTDVDWRDPTPVADAMGLYYPEEGEFLRGDIAQVCFSALDCPVYGAGMNLGQKLKLSGALTEPEPVQPPEPDPNQLTVSSVEQVQPALRKIAQSGTPVAALTVPVGQEETFSRAVLACANTIPDVTTWNVSYMEESGQVGVNLFYNDAARVLHHLAGQPVKLKEGDAALLDRARKVCGEILRPEMSDYERVKACHDYLVNHVSYDTSYGVEAPRAYAAAGALLDGKAVCDGYSKAFQLLCELGGVNCIRVVGQGKQGGGHAWNKVELDGQWYNVDVTWDDPISSRPVLRYDYFLISDSRLARDHSWAMDAGWPEAPTDYVH